MVYYEFLLCVCVCVNVYGNAGILTLAYVYNVCVVVVFGCCCCGFRLLFFLLTRCAKECVWIWSSCCELLCMCVFFIIFYYYPPFVVVWNCCCFSCSFTKSTHTLTKLWPPYIVATFHLLLRNFLVLFKVSLNVVVVFFFWKIC